MTNDRKLGVRFRERLSRVIPKAITNYPFEMLVLLIGLIIGLPLLLGIAAPTSLVTLLPTVAYWAYASALVLGGVTIAVGLRLRDALVISSGLSLLALFFIIYGLAVLALSGLAAGWLAFGAYTVIGLLSAVRWLHFRRLVDIQEGATRIRDKEVAL